MEYFPYFLDLFFFGILIILLGYLLFQADYFRPLIKLHYHPSWLKKVSVSTSKNELLVSTSVTKVLGSGSFGFVYEVQEVGEPLKKSALKILFPFDNEEEGSETEQGLLQTDTVNEYHNLKGKAHQNVVQVSKCFIQEFTRSNLEYLSTLPGYNNDDIGKVIQRERRERGPLTGICLKMELCGSTLRKWLQITEFVREDVPFLWKQCHICQDIVDGIRFLHYNNILHRDLKPENIMFSKDFELPIKIGDFGLSRKINLGKTPSSSFSIVGTVTYNAPEKYGKRYNFPADLYAMGLIIWEVAQCIKYDQRRTMFEALVKDEQFWLIKPHPIFLNLRDLVINLTRPNPKERYSSISRVCLEFDYSNQYKPLGSSDWVVVAKDDILYPISSSHLSEFQIKSKTVAHMVAQIRIKQLGMKQAQDRMAKTISRQMEEDKDPETRIRECIQSFTTYREKSELVNTHHLGKNVVERIGYPNLFNETLVQLSMASNWLSLRGSNIIDDIKKGQLYNNMRNELTPTTLPRLELPSHEGFWGNENPSVSSVLLYGIGSSCGLIKGITIGAASFSPFLNYSLPGLEEYPFANKKGLFLFGDFQFGGHRTYAHPSIFGPEDASSSVGKAMGISTELVRRLNTAEILSAWDNPRNPYGFKKVLALNGGVGRDQWDLIEGGEILLMGNFVALIADKPDNHGNVATLQFTRDLDTKGNKKCGGGWFPYNLVDSSKEKEIYVLRHRDQKELSESISLAGLIETVDNKYYEQFPKYPVDHCGGDCGRFLGI